MGVPESFEALDEAVTPTGMRAVRVAVLVGELVMLAVIGDPADHVPLHGKLAADGEGVANGGEGLKRAVGKQAVVADGNP